MSDRTPPQVGEIWQHFKHRDGVDIFCGEYHQYQIWDVTEAKPQHPQAEIQPFSVQHVETGQFHNVFECDREWWVEGLSEPHVLYTVNFCTHTVWCRALAEFMAADERSETGWKFWRINPHPPSTE